MCVRDLRAALQGIDSGRVAGDEAGHSAALRAELATWTNERPPGVSGAWPPPPAAIQRGQVLLRRGALLTLLFATILVVCVGASLFACRRRKLFEPLSRGVTTAPWSLAAGTQLLLISGAIGLGLSVLGHMAADATGVPALGFGAISYVPMVLMLKRRLAPTGVTTVNYLGLRPHARIAAILTASAGLIGIEQTIVLLTGMARGAVSDEVGPPTWLRGELVVGSPGLTFRAGLDMLVVAPFFEEIAFRGILYPSLRTRMGLWPAAAVTAAVFAAVHFARWPVAVILFVSAIPAAVVYEKTRSLVPPMVAHVVNNTMGFLAITLYR
jgi:membrane protease YdiL (CAAX protease family)